MMAVIPDDQSSVDSSSSSSMQPRFMLDANFHTPRLVSPAAFKRASRYSRPDSAASQPTAAFLPISASTNDLTYAVSQHEQFPVDVDEDEDEEEGAITDLEEFQVMNVTNANPHRVSLIERPWPSTNSIPLTPPPLPTITPSPAAAVSVTSNLIDNHWRTATPRTACSPPSFVDSTTPTLNPLNAPLPPLPSSSTGRLAGLMSEGIKFISAATSSSRTTPETNGSASISSHASPRERLASHHARSMSNSTTVSSTASEAGVQEAAIGKQSRLRSLSDNLRRMSMHKQQRPAVDPQNSLLPLPGLTAHSPPPLPHQDGSTRVRKASLTIESFASNQPSSATKVAAEAVYSEVLRPNDVSTSTSSTGNTQQLDTWTVEGPVHSLPDVRMAGWKVATEGQDGGRNVSSSVENLTQTPAFPLRKRASDTGVWQKTEQRSRPPSQATPPPPVRAVRSATEVLVPSNFNSYPSSRSASQQSAYARRKTSMSSESVAADQQSGGHGADGRISLDGNTHPTALVAASARQRMSGTSQSLPGPPANIESGPLPPRRRSRAGSMGASGVGQKAVPSGPGQYSTPPSAWNTTTSTNTNNTRRRQSTGSEDAARSAAPSAMPASLTQDWQQKKSTAVVHDDLSYQGTLPQSASATSPPGRTESLQPSHISMSTSLNEQVNADMSYASPALQTTLDEEDIEVVEEEPFIETDTDLYVIRRRLVKQFSDLGTKRRTAQRPEGDGPQGEEDALSMAVDEIKAEVFATEKEKRKRQEALEARERALTVEALSKAEMAYAHIEVWTESRRGKWTVRGPADEDSLAYDVLPAMHNVWAYPIDAKGIVRRNKLKSNIEISSSRTVIECPDCRQAAALNIAMVCTSCKGSQRLEMSYVIQCTVRLAQFLPLKLPACLLAGAQQAHIKYVDTMLNAELRAEVLRERGLAGLQGAASRVARVHHEQHASRLLMGRVRISRKGRLTVSVRNVKGKSLRVFDIDDGAQGKLAEVLSTTTDGASNKRHSHIARILSNPSTSSKVPASSNASFMTGLSAGAEDLAVEAGTDENVDVRSHRGGGNVVGRLRAPSTTSKQRKGSQADPEDGLSTDPHSPNRTPKASQAEFDAANSAQSLSGKKSLRSIFRQKIK